MTSSVNLAFPHTWRADILAAPPLIAPARQFTYPHTIAGEEDALARGALQVLVHPESGGDFLATCALGFTHPSMPTGVWSCPDPQGLCAVAGGYAYILDTAAPERSTHIPLRPVVEVLPLPEHGLLLFAGFHSVLAWSVAGLAWQSGRLSWEGLRLTGVRTGPDGSTSLTGLGWNMKTDKEVEFAIDLRTGAHTGGGF
ncbi:MAG TPA: hypothetical protein VG714_01050 [Acidobacteriaceae bacterium]|nr:hypothetical protein [Acidobacteriaceae bacterium]